MDSRAGELALAVVVAGLTVAQLARPIAPAALPAARPYFVAAFGLPLLAVVGATVVSGLDPLRATFAIPRVRPATVRL